MILLFQIWNKNRLFSHPPLQKRQERRKTARRVESIENKKQDGRFKPNHSNSCFKGIRAKHSYEKAEIIKLGEKAGPNYLPSIITTLKM